MKSRETGPRDGWEIMMLIVISDVVCQKIERAIIAVGFLIETVPDIVFGDEMTSTWV